MSAEIEPTTYNPHLPCELQGGHVWMTGGLGEDALGNEIVISVCANCGKVKAGK